jgi:DNA-binding winged helix-turn-helix (wHTH) protein/TolB-like protein/tetratricopeptide (TPR) repeat protein
MEGTPRRSFEFGRYRLDVEDRLLLRGADVIHLTPKAFDTLVLLVSRRGRLVSKDELIDALWPGTHVEENNLAQYVSLLRRTLADGLEGSAYIETVPRVGYRFVASVRETTGRWPDPGTAAPPPGPAPPAARRSHRGLFAAALVVVVLFALLLPLRAIVGRPALQSSVAVLPFETDSDELAQAGATLTVAADLIDRLAESGQGRVLPISSAYRFLGSSVAPAAAGRELGTGAVLSGHIRATGDLATSVSAQLTRSADGRVLWTGTFAAGGSIRDVEPGIAAAAAAALGWPPRAARRADGSTPRSFDARQAYVLGRYLWTTRSPENLFRSRTLLERAVALAPDQARFHAALADADAFDLAKWPQGEREARTALQLAGDFGQPHATLGFIRLFWQRDRKRADQEFATAIRLDPAYATAHEWFALSLAAFAESNGAYAEIEEARRLEPSSLPILADQCQIAYLSRDLERALAACDEAIRLDPAFAPAHVARLYVLEEAGRSAAALDEYARLCDVSRRSPCALLTAAGLLAGPHRENALPAFWRREIQLLERYPRTLTPPLRLAQDYARLGDKEGALAYLGRLADSADLDTLFVWSDPAFEALRDEPRFEAIAARIFAPRATASPSAQPLR